MIRKAYKYRLYPSPAQIKLLDKHFGCTRFVYNWALGEKIRFYQETGKSLSRYKLQNQLPIMKQSGMPWLGEVNAQSLQASLINLDRAFTNFFKKRSNFPVFKKKKRVQSFQIPQSGRIDFESRKLIIPKFTSGINCKVSRLFEGEAKTFTVSRTTTGKYFVSVLVETLEEAPINQAVTYKGTIGIDVGIRDFCTLSTGEKIKNPKNLKKELTRLKILQRRANKKIPGSKNSKKAFVKVARLHEKISNRRKDFLHKLTHRLTNDDQVNSLVIENLNIAGMMKNRHLSQAIADVSWSEFFRQLNYKAQWRGKNLLQIGRFVPSSRTCTCGTVNTSLKLSDKQWVCKVCGAAHDRDILAAQNIKRFALTNDNLKNSGVVRPDELAEMRCCNGDR